MKKTISYFIACIIGSIFLIGCGSTTIPRKGSRPNTTIPRKGPRPKVRIKASNTVLPREGQGNLSNEKIPAHQFKLADPILVSK